MTAPTGIEYQGNGIGVVAGDARYVRRFVSVAGVATLAGNTRTGINNVPETETILENPTGAVHGKIPQDVSSVLMGGGAAGQGDGGRFGTRLRVLRVGSLAANISLTAASGTYQAPGQLGNATAIGGLYGEAVDNAAAIQSVGAIEFITRAAITAANAPGFVRVRMPEVGSAAFREVLRLQAGSSTIAEWRAMIATLRVIPTTTGSLRNPGDTADLVTWNATGLGFFGVAPIARPNITGSRGGNAALASLLTQGALLGLWTDGTTA